jgi:hypothetical protein
MYSIIFVILTGFSMKEIKNGGYKVKEKEQHWGKKILDGEKIQLEISGKSVKYELDCYFKFDRFFVKLDCVLSVPSLSTPTWPALCPGSLTRSTSCSAEVRLLYTYNYTYYFKQHELITCSRRQSTKSIGVKISLPYGCTALTCTFSTTLLS